MNVVPNHKPITAKSAATKFVVKTLAAFAFVAVAFVLMAQGTFSTATVIEGIDNGSLGREVAKGSPADLLAKHDCWTGEAPADVTIPGAVVVTMDDAVAPKYVATDAMVGDALDKAFGGADHGIYEVHGFCR